MATVEEPKTRGERPAPLRVILWKRHDVNLGKTSLHFGARCQIVVHENKRIGRKAQMIRYFPQILRFMFPVDFATRRYRRV